MDAENIRDYSLWNFQKVSGNVRDFKIFKNVINLQASRIVKDSI